MLRLVLITGFCLAVSFVYAQEKLKARVFESKTRIRLAGIRVDNLTNKQTVLTDNSGGFNIPAKNGDLLALKGFAYLNDTVLVVDMLAKEIFMVPQVNELNQVNIINTIAPHVTAYYDPEFHGQTVVRQRDRKGNLIGGITIRLWYWKKDQRKRIKQAQQEQQFAFTDRIKQVFIPQIIAKYIPLKGKEMEDFIALYTPAVSVFSRDDFNLADYLNACYKKYQQLPPGKRQPEP